MQNGSWPAMRFLCLMLVALMSAIPANAGSWEPDTLEESVKRADAIVEGRVISVESWFELGELSTDPPGRNLIFSTVRIALEPADAVLKGTEWVGNAREITVSTVGGQVGDVILTTSATHFFKEGEQVLLLLRRLDGEEAAVAGAEFRPNSGLMDTYLIEEDGKVRSLRFDSPSRSDWPSITLLRSLVRDALASGN